MSTRFYCILSALAIFAAPHALAQDQPAAPAVPAAETATSQPATAESGGLLSREEVRRQIDAIKRAMEDSRQTGEAKQEDPRAKELELLERIDVAITQQEGLRAAEDELRKTITQYKADLATLRTSGPSEKRPDSFLLLEAVRSELQVQMSRAEQVASARQNAAKALEDAQKNLEAKEKARRQAKEALETNKDPANTGPLASALRMAELDAVLSRTILGLRERERQNQILEAEADELRLSYLKEKVAWIEQRAIFAEEDLNEKLALTERAELGARRSLGNANVELDAASQYLAEVRQRRDRTAEPTQEVTEELEAARLQREARQLAVVLLGDRLEQLVLARQTWTRRFKVINQIATDEELKAWLSDAQAATRKLTATAKLYTDELAQLRNMVVTLQSEIDASREAAPDTARWIRHQLASVRERIALNETAVADTATVNQLLEKLQADIKSRISRPSLKEWAGSAWDWTAAVWSYEVGTVEDRPITVSKIVVGIVILLLGAMLSRIFCSALARRLFPRMGLEEGAAEALRSLLYYAFLLGFALLALKIVNVPLTAFTILGGALAIGVGFGSQNIINNFISGLILLVERPIKIGDLIQVEDLIGTVERIGPRSTRVRSPANMDIIVPNSEFLEKNVINWTLSDDRHRTFVAVGVVYGSPTRDVANLIRRAVEEHGKVLEKPEPIVLFTDFGDNSLNFEVHFWIHMRRMMDRRIIESDIRYRIDGLFREAGIVIAFPQRDVHLDSHKPIEVKVVPAGDHSDGADETAGGSPIEKKGG